MKKKILALLMCMVLAAGLAACGSSDDPKTGDDKTTAEDNNDTADGDAAVSSDDGDKIAAIKDAGKIILLTEATFPPFEYLDGTEYAGIDIDVGQAIADKLGVELEIVDMNFDLLTDALNSDKGDFIAAGFSITADREKVVDFTKEYVTNGLMVVVAADSTFTSLEELADETVAVQESTTGHELARTDVVNSESNILAFKSTVEAGSAVRTGKCAAAIIDKLPAESIVRGSNGELKLMEDVYEEEATAIAVKKGNTDLLELIQEVLDELEASGKLQEYIDYHLENASDE